MILLAYQTLLRGSEVARMNRADVSFATEDGVRLMRIHVDRMAKNDAERKGHTRLVEEKTDDSHLCLARMIRAYLAATERGAEPADPLFPKEGGARMKEDTPRGRLKRWLGLIGVEKPDEYGFHSLRAGGATTAKREDALTRFQRAVTLLP